MDDITQYTLAYFHSDPPVKLAEKLVEIAPGDNDKKYYTVQLVLLV